MISSVVVESRRELIGGVIILCSTCYSKALTCERNWEVDVLSTAHSSGQANRGVVLLRSTEASRDTVLARVVLAEGSCNRTLSG